jgi:hypothetical protein
MEDPKEPLSDKERLKLKRQEMREKAMDMMFGKNRHVYEGNIWGWKFSIISLIGLLLIVSFAAIGVATGNISLDEQLNNARKVQEEKNKNHVSDSLKSKE